MIDFTGPWEVFQDVVVPGRTDHPFRLYTVSESTSPIRASGGMKIVPDYTFGNAPAPKVIVIPAQSQPSEATLEWIRKSDKGHRRDHVGLHWRICAGKDRSFVGQSSDHISRCVCFFR